MSDTIYNLITSEHGVPIKARKGIPPQDTGMNLGIVVLEMMFKLGEFGCDLQI